MSHFWTSFFLHLKDCGRSATLFMITLAGLLMLLVVIALLCEYNVQGYVLRALPGAGVFAVIWAGVTTRRVRARRRERLVCPPLSFDERRKARSKLVKCR